MKIGLIAAMQKEREQLEKSLASPRTVQYSSLKFSIGVSGDNEVVLLEAGIGKVNAAIGTVTLIRDFAPDCIISVGVAGAMVTSLDVMDAVVSRRIVYHDVDCGPENFAKGQVQGLPLYFDGDEKLLNCALSLQTSAKIVGGLICSGDQFIYERARLDAIKANFPDGLAVDMESAAIAQTCYIFKIPFLSFRIISDVPGSQNDLSQYSDFWSAMADRSFEVTRSFLDALSDIS